MKREVVCIALALIMWGMPGIGHGAHVIDSQTNPQFLYVLSAKTGSFDGDRLTLHNVPMVIYFSDRPNRIAGHMSLKMFVALWGQVPDSFKADPPNATLSIFHENGNQDVIVELMEPQMKGDTITFRYKLLKGKTVTSFGASSVFVDAYPTPVNPQVTD